MTGPGGDDYLSGPLRAVSPPPAAQWHRHVPGPDAGPCALCGLPEDDGAARHLRLPAAQPAESPRDRS